AGRVTTEPFTLNTLHKLELPAGTPVYLTVDLDVIDPSEFPGTGTQEAGGVGFVALLAALRDILGRFNVVALDNVELSPPLDHTGRSTALACKLLREELLSLKTKGEPANV
ncbi:MAG: arginase family protein, partial [Kiritimatiellae bacterium]|nr:arginase family protein [Kiritimatiellia bacterium]